MKVGLLLSVMALLYNCSHCLVENFDGACKPSAIHCYDEHTYTFCFDFGDFIGILKMRFYCPEGYVCDEDSRFPCLLKSSSTSTRPVTTIPPDTTFAPTVRPPTTIILTTTAIIPTTTSFIPTTPSPTTTTIMPTTTSFIPTTTDTPRPTTTTRNTVTITAPTQPPTTPATPASTTTRVDTTPPTLTPTLPSTTTQPPPTTTQVPTSTLSPTTARPKPTGPPDCQAEGLHPGPICQEYYECVRVWFAFFEARHKACDEGYAFSIDQSKCVLEAESGCID